MNATDATPNPHNQLSIILQTYQNTKSDISYSAQADLLTALQDYISQEIIGDFENTEGNKPHGDVRNSLRKEQRRKLGLK